MLAGKDLLNHFKNATWKRPEEARSSSPEAKLRRRRNC